MQDIYFECIIFASFYFHFYLNTVKDLNTTYTTGDSGKFKKKNIHILIIL